MPTCATFTLVGADHRLEYTYRAREDALAFVEAAFTNGFLSERCGAVETFYPARRIWKVEVAPCPEPPAGAVVPQAAVGTDK
jgi:hypothetical protein